MSAICCWNRSLLSSWFLLFSVPSACLPNPGDKPKAAQAEQRPQNGHFYVVGSQLFDRCGEPVVLRGVNKMVIWTDRQGDSFPEIAKTGANSVRIVWTVEDHHDIAELDHVIGRAIGTKLIPIIELHDATGDLSKVPRLVDFWVRPEVVEVLKRYEPDLLLNIANEAGSNGVRNEEFVSVYSDAIRRLRAQGLKLPLMIDAPQWGQDIDLLQGVAAQLLAADPQKNLLFSAHLWWPKGTDSEDPGSGKRIKAELQESADMGLPLVVGEFAHAGVGCQRFIDYHAIVTEAQRHNIGWLAWSWGPGNKDCIEMDMTSDGTFETLHGWGLEVAVTNRNSIKNTSKIPVSIQRGKCQR